MFKIKFMSYKYKNYCEKVKKLLLPNYNKLFDTKY